jgi:hypothetical protein
VAGSRGTLQHHANLTLTYLHDTPHTSQNSEEGVSHEGRMEKLKKLFGAKFGSKGPRLFNILSKSVDKIRAIVKEKKKKDLEEKATLLCRKRKFKELYIV